MKKAKKTTKEVASILENVVTGYEIIKNGHCFELHKMVKGGTEKVFIKANTNRKDFETACEKYKK